MEQTMKYIKVLNWGYGGFAPMTISPDFEHSYKQVVERLQLLGSLDYDKLLDEAISPEGKAYLEKYSKTDTTFEYGLHFMKDINALLSSLVPDYWDIERKEMVINPNRMFRKAFDTIDKCKADGIWTDEQWREYRWTLSEIEKGFDDRLRQFATAYDYSLEPYYPNQQATTPDPQQKDLHYYCHKAIEKGCLVKEDGGYRRASWSKAQLAYFLGKFLKPDGTFPDKEYCIMFGESRLGKALGQLINNKTGNGKPKGYEVVDALLNE